MSNKSVKFQEKEIREGRKKFLFVIFTAMVILLSILPLTEAQEEPQEIIQEEILEKVQEKVQGKTQEPLGTRIKFRVEAFLDWIQQYSTLAVVLLTIVLILITWKYARDTKRMADIMAKDYELRIRPLIDIGGSGVHFEGWDRIETRRLISNKGYLSVTAHEISVEWWLKNNPENKFKKAIEKDITIHKDSDHQVQITLTKSDLEESREDLKSEKYAEGPNKHIGMEIVVRYSGAGMKGKFEKRKNIC